jgi:hypothetical protein
MRLPDANDLAEAIRLGELSAQQEVYVEQYLASHPDERPGLEEELALSRLLADIPNLPVPSNFTARVRQAVQAGQSSSASDRTRVWHRFVIRRWMPQVATVGTAVTVAWLAYAQHQAAGRQELARNLAEISRLAGGTSVEVLENFDAIERLNQVPRNEARELMAALE